MKVEMEEFKDLGPYLAGNPTCSTLGSTDELNTPIFDRKGPFDFMIRENTSILLPTTAADPFKFDHDTIRAARNSVPTNRPLNDFSVYSNNVDVPLATISNNSEIVNIVQGPNADLFAPSGTDYRGGHVYLDLINGNETLMQLPESEERFSASLVKTEDSAISVSNNDNSNVSSPIDDYYYTTNLLNSNEAQYSHISSPSDGYSTKHFGIDTPEDSNSCTEEDTLKKVPKLKLSLAGIFSNQSAINTPEIIDSVVNLESKFNILDYIDDKNILATVNIEDIHIEAPSSPTSFSVDPDEDFPKGKIRKRKARSYDDDDEDYMPPSRKKAARKISEDFDSDSEDELVLDSGRERPSRRNSSISDHSDASKYRELRDKNNEASRKSRLKRKVKEMTLEKESDLLEQNNIKLRARVEELDKMVNNFRNNLFQIMLKK